MGAGCEEAGESGEQEDDSGRFLRQGGVGRKQSGDTETDTQTHTRRGREMRGVSMGMVGRGGDGPSKTETKGPGAEKALEGLHVCGRAEVHTGREEVG